MNKLIFILFFLTTLLTNSFAQWLPLHSGTTQHLKAIQFQNAQSGLACGDHGTLLKTSDKGQTWQEISLNTDKTLYSIFYMEQLVFLAGDSGEIYKSDDAGANWSKQTSSTTLALNDVFFTDDSKGWIAGDSGLILQTENVGASWHMQTTPTSHKLNSVFFINNQNGFAAGNSGTLLKTSDGGDNWQAVSSVCTKHLRDIVFINNLHGFAVGDSGCILQSDDGGDSWVKQQEVTDFHLFSISVIDSLHIWIAGGKDGQGLLLKTNDDGNSWTENSSGLFPELNSVFFYDLYSGYTTGQNGKIFQTESGGIVPPSTPLLQSPQSGITIQQLSIDLSWDAVTNAGFYRLQIATDFRFNHTFFEDSTLTDVHFIIDDLDLETTYYWRVKAQNILGASPWSNTRHFSTLDYGPQLLQPVNGNEDIPIPTTLTWQEKENAEKYWLQISPVSDFSNLIINDSTIHESSFLTEILSYRQQYFWRARSKRNGYFSLWSEPFAFITYNGLEGWTSQWSGTKSTLNHVFFHDDQRGWVVGASGKLLKTNNGGASWQAASSGTTANLETIHFLNDSTGWISDWSGKILKTTDGGHNWTAQSTGTSLILRDVSFCDPLCGWAVGERGIILKSTDGGGSWSKVSNITNNEYYEVFFSSPDTGWVVGANWNGSKYNSLVLYTDNGGEIWTSQNFTSIDFLTSLFFIDENEGWAAGEKGSVLHTVNGGRQWIIQHSSSSFDLYSICFTDAQNGWAVGNNGTCIHTSDGGQTWSRQATNTRTSLRSIHVKESGKGWTVGSYGTILQTASSGFQMIPQIFSPVNNAIALSLQPIFRWHKVPLVDFFHLQVAADSSFQELVFDNSAVTDTVLAVGPLSENKKYHWRARSNYRQLSSAWSPVFSFTTGGVWVKQENPSTAKLNDVFFTDILNGAVVGDSGTVLKTNDSGLNWRLIDTPVQNNLHSLFFVNTNNGWAVGDSGKIIKTINGGENWTNVPTSTSLPLKAVYFVGQDTGWVVGGGLDSGSGENYFVILKTTNGGESWIIQMRDDPAFLSDVFFVDAYTGWAVGDGGDHKILKTTNGGQTWTAKEIATEVFINKVYFKDAQNGYVAGNGGKLFKTSDGGENWKPIKFDSVADIYDFYFPSAGKGLVLANGIFTSQDSCASWDVQFFEGQAIFKSLSFASEEMGWIVGNDGLILKTSTAGFPMSIDVEERNSYPHNFKLLQNYPNPFNPKTVISYRLPVISDVELTVYNTLGQKVKILVNKKQQPGSYSVSFNSSGLASGIYIYRIKTSSGFVQSKKCILIK